MMIIKSICIICQIICQILCRICKNAVRVYYSHIGYILHIYALPMAPQTSESLMRLRAALQAEPEAPPSPTVPYHPP